MYVNYCKNKPDSNQLLLEHAGPYFDVSDYHHYLPSLCYKYLKRKTKTNEWIKSRQIPCGTISDRFEFMQRHKSIYFFSMFCSEVKLELDLAIPDLTVASRCGLYRSD